MIKIDADNYIYVKNYVDNYVNNHTKLFITQ